MGAMRGIYVVPHAFERGPCPESPLLLPAIFSPDEIGPRVQGQAFSVVSPGGSVHSIRVLIG
jgi:hypothetical protein